MAFEYAAAAGMGSWYGFATREAAEAWLGDRDGVVAPVALVRGTIKALPAVEPPSPYRRRPIDVARDEAAVRNARNFGTDPSWYGR